MKEEVSQVRKHNMKIYALYRMLSMDHIFYYAIEFMFLTEVKGLTAADIVLGSSVYALFMMILQIPAVMLIDKLGNKKCTVLANLFLAAFVFTILNCQNISTLILAQFFDAIGFSLKDTSDTSLLNVSIPETTMKSEIYSKIEGKGLKNYYFFSAISSITAGILYEINPYIPIIISFLISIMASMISLGFEEIKQAKSKSENIKIKDYFRDLVYSFQFILHSNRLKALLLYSGIIWGIFCLMNTCITSLLTDLGAVATVIAIISAIKDISSGIGAKRQLVFHNKLKNKSLKTILIITLLCIWIIGLVGILQLNMILSIGMIVLTLIVLQFIKGVHGVLTTRYLQNFTNESILPKIYAVNSISRNIFRVLIGFIGSYLLRITNTANAIIVIGIMFTFVVMVLILYMKNRVGLKPEEYSSEETKFG